MVMIMNLVSLTLDGFDVIHNSWKADFSFGVNYGYGQCTQIYLLGTSFGYLVMNSVWR